MAEQQATAELRKNFEKAVFQIKEYVGRGEPLSCFVSYAWGDTQRQKAHMRWVEKQLAMDLKNAGIGVILDRWHNAAVGSSIPRFVGQIEKAAAVVVVGTPLYRRKYENKVSETGSVVAAEVDLIDLRHLGTEQQKETVYPVLLDGTAGKSLPPLMQGRVYADFRKEEDYLPTIFDLILSIYKILPDDRVAIDLRASLRPGP